jgi:hypothetical protein
VADAEGEDRGLDGCRCGCGCCGSERAGWSAGLEVEVEREEEEG